MKAVWFEQFGTARDTLVLGDQPVPEPGAGEVLVRLKATGVNPSDVKKRAGSFPDLLDNGLVIPHSDGAGIIEAVGPGGDTSRIGERVWVYQAQYGRRLGTAAEYVALDEKLAVPLPENTSFEIGACLGIPVMTAHRCVFADGDVKGSTILITGGAGRVGFYAIQWAKQAGAKVITTASNSTDRDTCLALGADAVVNHRDENWAAAILEANDGKPVDRVVEVEFGKNLPQVLDCLRIGGTIATYSSSQDMSPQLPFYRMMFMDITVRMVIVYAMPEQAKQDAIRDITAALEQGKLQHRVADVLPLEKMAEAHEIIEGGTVRGCVVVAVE
ncbi:NADPH:quinone reductase [Biformimicrobium ophioploci]|uniref:NADPH:quinone reductase n=1 Tax=Biformimicrobium ophioploci TaxID=3036711 RepID=A0ABQ6LVS1_9GAMM|nr:NADPH:quinone reductase [Microbulbifer sp. NKW57]GMG86137.1 NADPH:quinone reductase [Microbulbifer sp. NKW57]